MQLSERLLKAMELRGVSQADLARACKVKPPSVHGWLSGKSRFLRGENLLSAAQALRVNQQWLATGEGSMEPLEDIRLIATGVLGPRPGTVGEQPAKPYLSSGDSSTLTPIVAWDHAEDLPPGEYVFIPRLAITLSAGNGHDQIEFEFVKSQPQAFRADWVRAQRLRPAKLASMTAKGDSMEDRIHDGDALVVDTSQTDVIDGKPYALWYEGGERVKRLFRIPGGGLRISSDNRKYPDIVLAAQDLEHVRIIGRVVHVAGSGGL